MGEDAPLAPRRAGREFGVILYSLAAASLGEAENSLEWLVSPSIASLAPSRVVRRAPAAGEHGALTFRRLAHFGRLALQLGESAILAPAAVVIDTELAGADGLRAAIRRTGGTHTAPRVTDVREWRVPLTFAPQSAHR